MILYVAEYEHISFELVSVHRTPQVSWPLPGISWCFLSFLCSCSTPVSGYPKTPQGNPSCHPPFPQINILPEEGETEAPGYKKNPTKDLIEIKYLKSKLTFSYRVQYKSLKPFFKYILHLMRQDFLLSFEAVFTNTVVFRLSKIFVFWNAGDLVIHFLSNPSWFNILGPCSTGCQVFS